MTRHLALGLVLPLLLAGCSMFGEDETPPPCPRLAALPDATTLTRFQEGPGRDLIDIEFEGKVMDVKGMCEYDIDEDDPAGTLKVEMTVQMQFSRGPADEDRRADFAYFVAVTDTQQQVLNKSVFDGTVEFPGNYNVVTWTDGEPVRIGIPIEQGQTGRNFEIIVGFQLDRGDLQYNRSSRAQTRP